VVSFPKHFFARKGIGFVKQRFLHHIQLLSQRADKNLSYYDQIKNDLLKYCLSWFLISFSKFFLPSLTNFFLFVFSFVYYNSDKRFTPYWIYSCVANESVPNNGRSQDKCKTYS